MTQLAKVENQSPAVQEPSVALMLQGALANIQAGNITPEHVEVLGKMMDLYERNDEREAKRAFATALTVLQGETLRVVATKAVDPKADGTCRYRFAAYEDIMAQVQPMLTRHGFSITFDTEVGENRLTSICTLTHSGGFSRSNRFAVRYGKPPGSSDAQGDMSTKSYAKRGALCDALNIAIDHDNDAAAIGETVTPEQAANLRELCEATETDEAKFLRFASASKFEDISADRFDELVTQLKRKEKAR